MKTSLPAVQWNLKRINRWYVVCPWNSKTEDKRAINRRHRRHLNALTRAFQHDPGLFDDEPFDAPSLSVRDFW